MTVRVYRNTDVGAPPLRGNTPGDVVNLLTKCLVDGYGSQAPAGWSRPYISGAVAVFRQGSGGMRYLRVDDNYITSTFAYQRVVAYDTMSDVNTGLGAFPSEAQLSGGLWWYTHTATSAENADARGWTLLADDKLFYVFWTTRPSSEFTNGNYAECYYFGDINAYGSLDAWCTIVAGKSVNTDYNSGGGDSLWTGNSIGAAGNNNRIYAARRYDGIGGSDNGLNHLVDSSKFALASPVIGNGSLAFPNSSDGRYYTTDIEIGSSTIGNVVRGKLPGVVAPCHPPSTNPNRNATFEGQGDLAGRSFIAYKSGSCCLFFETSDTWRD